MGPGPLWTRAFHAFSLLLQRRHRLTDTLMLIVLAFSLITGLATIPAIAPGS
ncbi:MAG: hypothetical protein QUV07_01275 [Cyanobium sp. CZS 25K]|nr:hypothetical protein [Cyanobium sp. CZS25K]